jgi:(p)ppGpp synthase/HD superfamily hydrolase
MNAAEQEFCAKQSRLLAGAIALAATRHQNQFDKAGRPYILHLLAVMQYLETDDDELMQMGVLHDIIEDDTNTTYAELILMGFSSRVVDGIRLLTKVPGQTHEEYKAGVLSTYDSVRVKRADVRHNSDILRLKGITEKDFKRMQKYHHLWVELTDALKAFERQKP